MSAIAEFTLPARSFPLGSVFESYPGVTVELERVVPTNQEIIPYVWIRGISHSKQERLEQTIRNDEEVQNVELLDKIDRDYLLRIQWETAPVGIRQAIVETAVTLVSGVGNASEWIFEIRGDERESIASFQQYCHEHDLPIQLNNLRSLARIQADAKDTITDEQHEALTIAFQRGYYQTPRETTLQEMGDEIGITGQAFGARFRGGTYQLIKTNLITGEDSV